MAGIKTFVAKIRAALSSWKIFIDDIPAKPGQAFDIKLANGDVVLGLVAGRPGRIKGQKGLPYLFCGCTNHGVILRELGFFAVPIPITYYRLKKPTGISAAEETRARRENEWRTWASDAASLTDNPYPEKKREGVRQ